MASQGTPTGGGVAAATTTTTPTGPRTPAGGVPRQADTPGRRRMLSPGQFLSPNDDEKERARVRAARAAQRTRSLDVSDLGGSGQSTPGFAPEDNILSQESLSAMLQNCLKLSNANKINQGNTWDLKLIDHLSDLVKNDVDENAQTNFQLASCTLETGVKIYSYRVDSVHSEAYKLLGGLGRSAQEEKPTETASNDGVDTGTTSKPTNTASKKAGSTLLASEEAINIKKLDVAFNVDPLFHQMSALFDDGGASGLLLNNLSVYSGCEIVFDSFEVPETKMKAEASRVTEEPATIDLSFMKDSLDQMMDALREGPEITPSLKEIVKLLNDPRRAEFEADCRSSLTADSPSSPRSCSDGTSVDGTQFEDIFSHAADDGSEDVFTTEDSHQATTPDSGNWSGLSGEQHMDGEQDGDDETFMSQEPSEWLAMATGMPLKSNAWGGPDHWKFAKPKEPPPSGPVDLEGSKKSQRSKKEPVSIDFLNWNEIDLSPFGRPKHRLSYLPQKVNPPSMSIPYDYGVTAANLAERFELPSMTSFRRGSKARSEHMGGTSTEAMSNDDDAEVMWGGEGEWEENFGHNGDAEGGPPSPGLVPEPRKVQKISVTYDKRAKQVDVRLLKSTIWEQVQHESSERHKEPEQDVNEGVSFQYLLQHFPEECPAFTTPEDVSVHLCFICLLHLANENSLRIDGCAGMDDLRIHWTHDGQDVVQEDALHI